MLEVGTVEFSFLRQRGITRRQKLVNELVRSGYGVIDDPRICKKGEIILNRGLNPDVPGDSNFFVFVKTSSFGRTKVFFTDPSREDGGKALTKRQLMRRFSSSKVKDEWVSEVKDAVLKTAAAKDTNTRYACAHGHWGENGGKDDGVSSRTHILREMMLWHYDIDATGYHNWINAQHFEDIADMEDAAGIMKVPSLELTLPAKNLLALNGMHLNIDFKDLPTALDFWDRILKGRTLDMPGMAPRIDQGEVLMTMDELREANSIAARAAHTYGIINVGIGQVGVGALNDPEKRERSISEVLDFIQRHIDLVGSGNFTFPDKLASPQDPETQAFFEMIVRKHLGTQATLDQKNISIAFSMHCKKENGFRKRQYADPDLHVYEGVRTYMRVVSPLAWGRTVIHFSKEAMGLFHRGVAFRASDLVYLMRKQTHFARDGADYGAKISIDSYLELQNGIMKPVKARRSPLRKLILVADNAYHGMVNVHLALKNLWNTIRNMKR
ncbi:MAG: hypothetical protein PHQ80_02265 [Candidatus ainarchaeum sp.]|nr:hypothetical protein [Candidatus ainarchaeum sp.]